MTLGATVLNGQEEERMLSELLKGGRELLVSPFSDEHFRKEGRTVHKRRQSKYKMVTSGIREVQIS